MAIVSPSRRGITRAGFRLSKTAPVFELERLEPRLLMAAFLIDAPSLPAHPRLLTGYETSGQVVLNFSRVADLAAPNQPLAGWYEQLKSAADSGGSATPEDPLLSEELGFNTGYASGLIFSIYRLGLVYNVQMLNNDAAAGEYAKKAYDLLYAAKQKDWGDHPLFRGGLTYAFALAYDWFYDGWDDVDTGTAMDARTFVATTMVHQGVLPTLPSYNAASWVTGGGNWNMVINSSMIMSALALAGEDGLEIAGVDDVHALAQEVLGHALPSVAVAIGQFDANHGAWHEGPSYWSYATGYGVPMIAALVTALGDDWTVIESAAAAVEMEVGDDFGAGFEDTGLYPIYNVGPKGRTFNYGDAYVTSLTGGPQLLWLAHKFERPEYAWYRSGHLPSKPHPLDLLWYYEAADSYQPASLPTGHYFAGTYDEGSPPAVELATMRTSWTDPNATFVGFKAGTNGETGHRQLDVGTFVLDALGYRWAEDLGPETYGYGSVPPDMEVNGQPVRPIQPVNADYSGAGRWLYYRGRAEGHNTLVIGPTMEQVTEAIEDVQETAEGIELSNSGIKQAPRSLTAAAMDGAADQRIDAHAKIIDSDFDTSAGDSFVIADLTPAYWGVEQVLRGIRMIEDSVLIQDEITPADEPVDVAWSMHLSQAFVDRILWETFTGLKGLAKEPVNQQLPGKIVGSLDPDIVHPQAISIEPDGRSAMLRQEDARLWLKIIDGPAEARFTLVPVRASPVTWRKSEYDDIVNHGDASGGAVVQHADDSYIGYKLVIHMAAVSETARLAVWMVPLANLDDQAPEEDPQVTPLAGWGTTASTAPAVPVSEATGALAPLVVWPQDTSRPALPAADLDLVASGVTEDSDEVDLLTEADPLQIAAASEPGGVADSPSNAPPSGTQFADADPVPLGTDPAGPQGEPEELAVVPPKLTL